MLHEDLCDFIPKWAKHATLQIFTMFKSVAMSSIMKDSQRKNHNMSSNYHGSKTGPPMQASTYVTAQG